MEEKKSERVRFSLIVGTLNRPQEIQLFLKAIKEQTYGNYEVIIVDQSDKDLTKNVVEESMTIRIKYCKVQFRGLSKARNVAMDLAEGEYICLMDDDAYYPENYLQELNNIISSAERNTIISGYIWDSVKSKDFVNYSKIRNSNNISFREMTRYCPSAGLTFPAKLKDEIGYFDEDFGIGAVYGACEETDYLIRAINKGYRIIYHKELCIIHPHEEIKNATIKDLNSQKIMLYAEGFGALVRKHSSNLKMDICYIESIIKDVIKIIFKSRIYSNELKGHIRGFLFYRRKKKKSPKT